VNVPKPQQKAISKIRLKLLHDGNVTKMPEDVTKIMKQPQEEYPEFRFIALASISNFVLSTFNRFLDRAQQKTQDIAETNKSRPSDLVEETKKPSEDRIVMLSDGIFAIAVTLLVLGIQIPPADTHSRDAFIKALTGDFLSNTLFYVVTFAVLASYWLEHRRLMNSIKQVDRAFLWLNLLFLAFVAFFPVATNIVQYAQFPEAVIVYTAVLAGCGYSVALLWIYALSNHRLIAANRDLHSQNSRPIEVALSPTFILASLCLLFIPNFPPSHVFYSWLLLPFMKGTAQIFAKLWRGERDE
jgi:uncharacterized membrane protein